MTNAIAALVLAGCVTWALVEGYRYRVRRLRLDEVDRRLTAILHDAVRDQGYAVITRKPFVRQHNDPRWS